MSKADFTAQQAAIAPAVAELDKPKIEVGQKWRARDGSVVSIIKRDSKDAAYPWRGDNKNWYTERGMDWDNRETQLDLVELIQDASEAGAIGIDRGNPAGGRHVASVEIPPGYDKLFAVLMQAFEQASGGKGKERHAKEGVPFEDQPMSVINRQLGSIDGFIYQAHKKSLEAKRLPDGRAQAELLGSINYIAGAVIAIDTWAKKDSDAD